MLTMLATHSLKNKKIVQQYINWCSSAKLVNKHFIFLKIRLRSCNKGALQLVHNLRIKVWSEEIELLSTKCSVAKDAILPYFLLLRSFDLTYLKTAKLKYWLEQNRQRF